MRLFELLNKKDIDKRRKIKNREKLFKNISL